MFPIQRIQILQQHLTQSNNSAQKVKKQNKKDKLYQFRILSTINNKQLKEFFYGKQQYQIYKEIQDSMKIDPDFHFFKDILYQNNQQKKDYYAFQLLKKIHTQIYSEVDPDQKKMDFKIKAYLDVLYAYNPSISIKYMLHHYMYTEIIKNYGTEKHKHFYEKALQLKDIGCFALKELSHGSNTKDINTTAHYDINTKQFIINTPDNAALKIPVANSVDIANMAIVFAQLYVGNNLYGIHAFIVEIRSQEDYSWKNGVQIGNCGPKNGLDSLQYGFIKFTNYKIPRENLLDKYSQVSQSGDFYSEIHDSDQRYKFFISYQNEIRVQIIQRSVISSVQALTIASRYAAVRKQFGIPGKPEIAIIEYPSVYYKLVTQLSHYFVIKISIDNVNVMWQHLKDSLQDNPLVAEVQAMIAVMKYISSKGSIVGIKQCKEICGGLSFSQYVKLGQIEQDQELSDQMIGDNNLLIQQTSRFLIECLRFVKQKRRLPYNTLDFLKANIDTVNDEWSDPQAQLNDQKYLGLKNLLVIFEIRANKVAIKIIFLKLIHDSAQLFQNNIALNYNVFDAWNHAQVFNLKDAAIAYGDVFIIKECVKTIEKIKQEKENYRVLKYLLQIWCLQKIVDNYHTFSYMVTHEKLLAIKQRLLERTKVLKDQLIGIIDSIAFPSFLVDSPLGTSTGQVYDEFLQKMFRHPQCFEKTDWWNKIHKKI